MVSHGISNGLKKYEPCGNHEEKYIESSLMSLSICIRLLL